MNHLILNLPAGKVSAEWTQLDAITTDRPVTKAELNTILAWAHEIQFSTVYVGVTYSDMVQ